MKHIKLFESFKNNVLYRFIDVEWFIKTLSLENLPPNINKMKGDLIDSLDNPSKFMHLKDKEFISFTRNSQFNIKPIKVVFDFDKLKHRYKFIPLSYFGILMGMNKITYDQSEERLILNGGSELKDWKNYIVEVEVLSAVLRRNINDKKYGYERSYDDIMSDIIGLCDKYNIKLVVK